MQIQPARCERAAQYVSLDLDGELSRFERAILTGHLRRCASCAEHARRVQAATTLVRATPLQSIRLALAPRRRTLRMGHALVAAVATAAVAASALWLGPLSGGRGNDHGSARASKLQIRTQYVQNDSYDWPAGPPRGRQLVQFVPGGRFTFSA